MRRRQSGAGLNRRLEIRQYTGERVTNLHGLPTGEYASIPAWAECLGGRAEAPPVLTLDDGNARAALADWLAKGTENLVRYRVRFIPAMFGDIPGRYAVTETVSGGIWGEGSYTAKYRVLKIEPDAARRFMVLVCEQVLPGERLPDAEAA